MRLSIIPVISSVVIALPIIVYEMLNNVILYFTNTTLGEPLPAEFRIIASGLVIFSFVALAFPRRVKVDGDDIQKYLKVAKEEAKERTILEKVLHNVDEEIKKEVLDLAKLKSELKEKMQEKDSITLSS